MENVAQMSVLQSEKVALQEMISTGSSEKYGTIAQAQKEYCFVCDYEELRGLSNKDIQKKLGFETFNDIDLYATFDMLKNDVKRKLLADEKFYDNIKSIKDLNLFDGNILNELVMTGIMNDYEKKALHYMKLKFH